MENVVHVLVGTSAAGYLRLDPGNEDVLGHYKAVGSHLHDHAIVRALATQVDRVVKCAVPTPFIVLENSAGTGKTQMAFNLEVTGRFEVFYIACAESDGREKTISNAFESRSMSFRWCVGQDATNLTAGTANELICETKLHLNSFLAAALDGYAVFSGRARPSQVQAAIQRRQEQGRKPMVFLS